MSTVWFTADPHFGHAKVSENRGFATTLEHDAAIMDNWRRLVQPEDRVWVLGDISVSDPSYALELLLGLPGEKDLIGGNHDGCHPMHVLARRHQRTYLRAFESVQPFARIKILRRNVLLSHFPYLLDRTPEVRYKQYRLVDEGDLLLHGHTHSSVQRTSARELHVGLDAWDLSPVSMTRVVEFVKSSAL